MIQHFWDAPAVPPTAPRGATVTARSLCGLVRRMPVWLFREWEATAKVAPTNPCPTCGGAS